MKGENVSDVAALGCAIVILVLGSALLGGIVGIVALLWKAVLS